MSKKDVLGIEVFIKKEMKISIKKYDLKILQKALDHIVKMNDGKLRLIDKDKFQIWSSVLGANDVTVIVANGQMEIISKKSDTAEIKKTIDMYYVATEVEIVCESHLEKDEKDQLIIRAVV